MRRPTVVLLAALALGPVLAATACTPATPGPTAAPVETSPAAVPSSAPPTADVGLDPAARTELLALQEAIVAAVGVQVESETSAGEGVSETASLSLDPQRREFEGTIVTSGAGESRSMRIIRASRLTWLQAEPAFWADQGYDPAAAAAAQGLFVAFEPQAGDTLAARYDPQPVLDFIAGLDPAEARPADGGIDIGGGTLLSLDGPGAFTVARVVGGAEMTIGYLLLDAPVQIERPAREETLIPQ